MNERLLICFSQAPNASSNAPSYPPPTNGNGNVPPAAGGSSSLPPLPQGKDLPPGMTCTDAISRTLNTLPPAQLLDILQQMKLLATNDSLRATELLNQAPQLTYAIFQALLLMGLVSPDAINSVIDAPAGAPVAAAPPPVIPGAPYGYPGATGTPPVAPGGGYAPPPVAPVAPTPAPAAAAPGVPDTQALMRAVMELSEDMINQLPEAERQQVLALRADFRSQMRR